MPIKSVLGRRKFMAGGVGAAVLAGLGIAGLSTARIDPYSMAAWVPLLGTTLKTDTGALVRLSEVQDLRNVGSSKADAGEKFNLRFVPVSGSAEQLVNFQHPTLGIVPVFVTGNGSLAHFNHQVSGK